MYLRHFPDDRKEFTDPHVDLFTRRRVENPLVVVVEKLGEPSGVAVVLAVLVIGGVLVDGVEDVDWESHAKETIVLHIHQTQVDPQCWGEDSELFRPERMLDGKFDAMPVRKL